MNPDELKLEELKLLFKTMRIELRKRSPQVRAFSPLKK